MTKILIGKVVLTTGGISLGLGGYISAKSQADIYTVELQKENQEMLEYHSQEIEKIRQIAENYGFQGDLLIGALKK